MNEFSWRAEYEKEKLRQRRIELLLVGIHRKADKIMATLDDILNDEALEATALGAVATGVQTLLGTVTTLQTELTAALSSENIPADVQAKIDTAFANANTNVASVQAIVANLPAPAAPTGATGATS